MLTEHRLPLYLPQRCFQLLLCWGLEYCDILHIYINSHFMFLLVNLTTKRARRFCGHKQPMLMNCWIKKRMHGVSRALERPSLSPQVCRTPIKPLLGRKACSQLRGPAVAAGLLPLARLLFSFGQEAAAESRMAPGKPVGGLHQQWQSSTAAWVP